MRVDPKRPLLGFALVAVLCAVLMALSVGQGWSFDFLKPGKPIVSAVGGHVERVQAPTPDVAEPTAVGVPVELSAHPLAVPPPEALANEAAQKAGEKAAEKASGTTTSSQKSAPAKPGTTTPTASSVDARSKPDRSAARNERKLGRTDAKEQRKAGREAAKTGRRAEKTAARAERHAAKAAEKAGRKG